MAQSGYTPIALYYSATASNAPSSANLVNGELALNITDGKLYYKDNGGAVQVLASKSTTGGTFPFVVATGTITGALSAGAFSYGTLGYTDTNIFGSFTSSVNSYNQIVLQNTNSGASASTDYVVSNNLGTATTYYGDFGMNSSGFSGTGSLSGASNVYLTSTSADLAIGTTTANSIHFVVNGGATDAMTINGTTQIVSFPTPGAIKLPAGTTGQQPTGVAGYLRFNTTTSQFEGYNGTTWNSVVGVGSATNTQVLYNFSGSVVGSANMTFNGTSLTLANDATIHGLTVGLGGNSQTYNTVFGNSAGGSNTTGNGNLFVGYQSGKSNTTGSGNSFVGGVNALGAGYSNTSGGQNTAIGADALASSTTASNNTAVGYQSLYTNTASNNTSVGYTALYSNTTGTTNVAMGHVASYSNQTGSNNISIGYGALYSNSSGSSNTALGAQTLTLNTTASNNTAVGYQAGYSTTTAASSVFIGYQAGYSVTTSSLGTNCFVGFQAGYNTTGGANTFIGPNGSGASITSGSYNTVIGGYSGNQGGLDIRTASNYIVLSDGAGNPRGIFDGSGNFGIGVANPNTSQPTTGVAILTGNYAGVGVGHISGTPSGYYYASFAYNGSIIGTISQAGTTGVLYNVTSDYRLKDVLSSISDSGSRIDALQPINYTMKSDGSAQRGFLAHQFQAVYPNSVSGEKDAVDAEGKPIYQAMQASSPEVMADLIAEIQSLRARLKAANIA